MGAGGLGREACSGRESVASWATVEPLKGSAQGSILGQHDPRWLGHIVIEVTGSVPVGPTERCFSWPCSAGHLTRHGADHKMNMSGWVLAHSQPFPRKGWQAALFQRKGIFSAFSCLRLPPKSPPTRCPGAQKRRREGLAKGECFCTACLFQAEWDRRHAPGHPHSRGADSFLGNPHPHHMLCWHRRVWSNPGAPPGKRSDSLARAPHPSPNPQTDSDVEATARHPSDTHCHPPLRATAWQAAC